MKNKFNTQIIRIISYLTLTLSYLGICNFVAAQNTIEGGISFQISPGTTVYSVKNLSVNTGGLLSVNGTLILKGDLINQNTSSDLGTGTIEFSGTSEQHISGANTIGNLTLNNPAGLILQGNTTVNSTLSLTNGLLNLGDNHLLIGTSGIITGTLSASKMVVATGLGELRKVFTGTGSFTFPVGDNTGTAEYSPVTVTHTSGTFSSGSYTGIRLKNEAYTGFPSNHLNRYWTITQSGITNPVYNAVFQYLPADVAGIEGGIGCNRVEPLPVGYFNISDTTNHRLSVDGATVFGTFTGWQAPDKTLNLTLLLEGLYTSGGNMRKAQKSGGDQFEGIVADQVSVELRQAGNYSSKVFGKSEVDLNTNGSASLNIPASRYGSYYITVKHRNSISITTAEPINFTGNTIPYSFDSLTSAYQSNLKQTTDNHYVMFGGDANGDGLVNQDDILLTTGAAHIFKPGYVAEDINGDGIVDALDLVIPDNNSAGFVSEKHP